MHDVDRKLSLPRIGHQPGRTPENNVISYLERHRATFPHRAALRWVDADTLREWDGTTVAGLPHREMTFDELSDAIERTAAALQELGLQSGDRVVIFLPMGPMMYIAMFAVQRIGAIAVFLDSWARRHQLGESAACVGPKAMISHRAAFELVDGLPEFGHVDIRIVAGAVNRSGYTARLEDLLEYNGKAPVAAVAAGDTALVTFTTGSSGLPKGANRTHRFLCAQHETLASLLPYNDHDADLPAFPIFSLNNMACGVTTVLPALDLAQPGEHDDALLVTQITHENATCATLSPSMLVAVAGFCNAKRIVLDGLRRVVTGGAPISRDNMRDFSRIAPRAECWILYGSTEVEPMAYIEARELLNRPENPDPDIIDEGVDVGRFCPGLDARIIHIRHDPIDLALETWAQLETAPGTVGELVVAGDHVCRDYYNNQDAFRQTKIVDETGRVWHRTGDLVRLDDNNHLWVVGRLHNVIERNGTLCFPVRAEILLKRFPFVRQAAFLGLPDSQLGTKTAAAIVLNQKQYSRENAAADIHGVFAKNGIPLDCLFFIDDIPMDPRHHSKVEYEPLRRRLLAMTEESSQG